MIIPPLRAWFLVVGTTLTLLCLFYLFFDRIGLVFGFTLSLLWNYIMLLHRHETSIDYFKGTKIEGQDAWKINESLQEFVNEFRCPTIEVYLTKQKTPLFLASTSEWGKPYLLLSENIFSMLQPQELHALIGLGVSSIKLRNSFFNYTFERMALSWLFIGSSLDRILLPIGRWNISKKIFYGIGWCHLRLAFPKSLQARADLAIFQILQQPRDLAVALWKLHGVLDTQPEQPLPEIFIHQSLLGLARSKRSAFHFILPIDIRLKFLLGYFPI